MKVMFFCFFFMIFKTLDFYEINDTPLMLASKNGQIDIVKLFLTTGNIDANYENVFYI